MAGFPRAVVPLAEASPKAVGNVLRLNQLNAAELSELDHARLKQLIAKAFHAASIDEGMAFLIAFEQDADYDSSNFQWFQSRYSRFVYVDRVAVAGSARGQGLASYLYQDLFAAAAAAGHSLVACEVNACPPNPASDSFHRAHGFEEIGRARLGSGKTVRYFIKRLSHLE